MAGNLSDNLCGHGGGGRDRFRTLNFCVTHLEAVSQHAFKVDQHAVKHWEERRVIQIVVVNFTAFVRKHHVTRQNVLCRVVFCHDTRQQIALGWDDFTVFVCVFVQQSGIALLNQATDFLIKTAALFTRHVTVVTILNVCTRKLLIVACHQLVFYCVLNHMDINTLEIGHLHSDYAGYGCTIISIINACRSGSTHHSFLDSLFVKWYLTTVPFNHYWFHRVAPFSRFVCYPQPQSACHKA